jgi:hypothetical protein
MTVDLRGALSAVPEAHYAAITDPKEAARLLRAIDAYDGHAYVIVGVYSTRHWSSFDLGSYVPRSGPKLTLTLQNGASLGPR